MFRWLQHGMVAFWAILASLTLQPNAPEIALRDAMLQVQSLRLSFFYEVGINVT